MRTRVKVRVKARVKVRVSTNLLADRGKARVPC